MTTRTTSVCLLAIALSWSLEADAQIIVRDRNKATASATAQEGIAVSLRAMCNVTDVTGPPDLFGATRLTGFLLAADELGPDCILLFEREPQRPFLRLDDISIAYRNVVEGSARPACSIDPRVETLKQLADVARKIGSAKDERSIQRNLRDWDRIGRGPQDVRVFNVNPETHFASVMVKADYDLKTICNGTTSAPGIVSLTDRLARRAQREIARNGTSSLRTESQNRFWFNPGEVSYRTDGSLFLLTKCQVTLLTEEEAITLAGERSGVGSPNPLAKEFANNLTKHFPELGRDRPVFRELENLYRAVAVMSLLVSEGSGVDGLVDIAFRTVDVPRVSFNQTLAGKVAVKKLQGSGVGGTYALWLPSCGGVSIDIGARSLEREEAANSELGAVAKRIIGSRPDLRAMSWHIDVIK